MKTCSSTRQMLKAQRSTNYVKDKKYPTQKAVDLKGLAQSKSHLSNAGRAFGSRFDSNNEADGHKIVGFIFCADPQIRSPARPYWYRLPWTMLRFGLTTARIGTCGITDAKFFCRWFASQHKFLRLLYHRLSRSHRRSQSAPTTCKSCLQGLVDLVR